MEVINQIINFLSKIFQWWIIIMPWEQGIFVRAGKNSKVITKGIYFKIPFLDSVYIQTVRKRVIDVPLQTMSSKDNDTITVRSVLSYQISNIDKLYNTLSHPEMTLQGIVMSKIGEYINENNSKDILIKELEEVISKEINKEDYGLSGLEVNITNFAKVKTFRFIQDSSHVFEGLTMNEKDGK